MASKYQAYPEYKGSGVQWLGEIPKKWERRRIKETTELINGYPFDSKKFEVGKGTPLVRIRDIRASKTEVGFIGDVPSESLIDNGDVLIGMDGDFNVSLWSGGEAALNQRVACVRAKNYHLQKFIYYVLPFNMKVINDLTYFTTVKHLSSFDILKTVYALPSERELNKIVNFLDHETAKIDTLIEKQQQLIKLLKEKRQAVISHAVTKGLNPNAPLRDSGVEWLGEVPEHWEDLSRIKYMSSLKGRQGWQGLKAEEYLEEGPYVVSSAHFTNHKIQWDDCPRVSPARYERDSNIQLSESDLLLMKDGAAMGKIAYVDELPDKACLNSHLLLFRPINRNGQMAYSPRFMYYFMQTEFFQSHIKIYGTGVTFLGISQQAIGNYRLVFPSLIEQQKITEFLEFETEKLDELAQKQQNMMFLLQERRTALISAAVTGKIDVRNFDVK